MTPRPPLALSGSPSASRAPRPLAPAGDIKSLHVALLKPKRGGRWNEHSADAALAQCVSAILDAVGGRRYWAPGHRARIDFRGRPRSTAELAAAFETIDMTRVRRVGRLHLGATTTSGEFLPLSRAFAVAQDSVVDAYSSLLDDVRAYRGRGESGNARRYRCEHIGRPHRGPRAQCARDHGHRGAHRYHRR